MERFAGKLEPRIGDDSAAFGQVLQEALSRVGPKVQMAFFACCRKLVVDKELVGLEGCQQPADILYFLKRQVDENLVENGF